MPKKFEPERACNQRTLRNKEKVLKTRIMSTIGRVTSQNREKGGKKDKVTRVERQVQRDGRRKREKGRERKRETKRARERER